MMMKNKKKMMMIGLLSPNKNTNYASVSKQHTRQRCENNPKVTSRGGHIWHAVDSSCLGEHVWRSRWQDLDYPYHFPYLINMSILILAL